MNRFSKPLCVLNSCLSFLPSILLGLLVSQALWLRLSLGRWPSTDRDNQGFAWYLGFIALYVLVFIVLGVVPWVLSLPATRRVGGSSRVRVNAFLFAGVIALILLLVVVNPFGYASWGLE